MEKYLVWIIKLSISGLLITPLLVSPQTIFPFVVGKALWFRSLVIIATTAFLVLKIKYKKDKAHISPIIIILIGFLIVNLIASLIGNSFTRSFWGTWQRMEGIITILYLILMIFVTSNIFNSLEEWKKIFQFNLIIGFFVTFISLCQSVGLPFRFLEFLPLTILYMPLGENYSALSNTIIDARINGTFSNPNFLSQYLSFIVFIGLGLLFEKSILIKRELINSNVFSSKLKKEFLMFFLIFFGIICSMLTIILTGSRGALLGLFIAFLITIPLIMLKINKKYIRYAFLTIFFSSLFFIISFLFYLTLAIDWSKDKYRNEVLEANLPKTILDRITINKIEPSFFDNNKFQIYGGFSHESILIREEVIKLSVPLKYSKILDTSEIDDRKYLPIIKNIIDNLMIEVDKTEEENLFCNEQLLVLNELIRWYYPEEFFNPSYKLPSGREIKAQTGVLGGSDYGYCSPIYTTLHNIHPSITYIINEGIALRHRKITYRMAWDAFQDKPLLGYGTESFSYIFYKYLKGTDFDGYTVGKWDRTHSRPLDVLTSSGILGLLMWIFIGIWIFSTIIKNIIQKKDASLYIFITGALTTFFVGNLLLFPQISTYIQSSLLISFLARSRIGFIQQAEKHQKKSEDKIPGNKLPQNIGIIGIIILFLISFYSLILIPFSASKNQLPTEKNTDLEIFSAKLSSFPQMATIGRKNLTYSILFDWNLIINSHPEKEKIISKIISVIEKDLEDSLKKEPHNFELNLVMWNYYVKIHQYNQSYKTKIKEKAKKLVELSPTNLVAQETMIKTALINKDLNEAKKWVKKWKEDHLDLTIFETKYWDESIKNLEEELN